MPRKTVPESAAAGSGVYAKGKCMYRVAAIFPEHFQSFTIALKSIFSIHSFGANHLSWLPNNM
jgi:hypothetical protein